MRSNDDLSTGQPGDVWRLARSAIVGIFVILVLAVLTIARDFFVPVVLALILTLVFSPIRRWLNRRGVPSWVCAVLVSATLLGLGGVGIATLSGPAQEWIAEAPSLGQQLSIKLRALRGSAEDLVEASEQIDEIAAGATGEGATVSVEEGESWIVTLARTLPMVGAQIVFVMVLTFFLLASGDMFQEKLVRAMPAFSDKRRALEIAREIESRLGRYLGAIVLVNAGLGVAIGLAMWAIGMPNPALFGVIAFMLNFVPYVGAMVGVGLATVVGFLSFVDPWWSVVAGGFYLLLTSIEGQFVTPFVVGRMLRLNTVVVFVSVAFWAWLWSAVGMIIAVPMLVILRVFSEYVPALRSFGDFLAERDVLVAPEKEDAVARNVGLDRAAE